MIVMILLLNSTSTTMDEQNFGTQNKEHLQSEFQVEIFESDSYENLPDLKLILKQDPTPAEEIQEETMVTTFRAINENGDTTGGQPENQNLKFDLPIQLKVMYLRLLVILMNVAFNINHYHSTRVSRDKKKEKRNHLKLG